MSDPKFQIKSDTKTVNFEQIGSKIFKKKHKNSKLLRKFRVTGFVVLFAIIFPKYAKTIAINRYQLFCHQY